jgi:hypothetical protein
MMANFVDASIAREAEMRLCAVGKCLHVSEAVARRLDMPRSGVAIGAAMGVAIGAAFGEPVASRVGMTSIERGCEAETR